MLSSLPLYRTTPHGFGILRHGGCCNAPHSFNNDEGCISRNRCRFAVFSSPGSSFQRANYGVFRNL